MARRDRDQEKKRRRQKRQEKRRRSENFGPDNPFPRSENFDPDNPFRVLDQLKEALKVSPPTHWPGASDPSLARPDMVKFDLTQFATTTEPRRSKGRQLEAGLSKGLMGFLPEIDHWAMEEFFWHGLPGDSWNPIDAYLAQKGDLFPPRAHEQIRLWKQAKIGLFEMGEIQEETVVLREWDPIVGSTIGAPMRAITLNIGGVNIYRNAHNQLTLTYLAPWAAAENLFCGMGYGVTPTKQNAEILIPYLWLRHPEIVARPLPWEASRAAADEYMREWRRREWHRWLGERMHFPFWALVTLPPLGKPQLKQVFELIPSTPEQARQIGIYFAVDMMAKTGVAAGGTHVTPIDVTSPNLMALREYHAYREHAGPPPATRGQPMYTILE
jgi:hypothetical protein